MFKRLKQNITGMFSAQEKPLYQAHDHETGHLVVLANLSQNEKLLLETLQKLPSVQNGEQAVMVRPGVKGTKEGNHFFLEPAPTLQRRQKANGVTFSSPLPL